MARLPPLALILAPESPAGGIAHLSLQELQQQHLLLQKAYATSQATCGGLREECLRLHSQLDQRALYGGIYIHTYIHTYIYVYVYVYVYMCICM
jgi:hypothetical protein